MFRNRLFDWGWKRTHQADVPVVSVGNITTGGTGKTPLVAFLANWFQDQGQKPAILSRGYRAVDGGPNDEKLVLDLLCPGIMHLQNPDRVASARHAVTAQQVQVLVLDDGFQHRRLARDLDLVLIDATCPWGYGAVLPRGLLREPRSGMKRADLAIITRADQVSEADRRRIQDEIQ
jgi:tetraacyldisaccharide 4'-kinase